MPDVQLTKDSDKFICLVYKDFLLRRKQGESKAEAALFPTPRDLQEQLFSTWQLSDISSCELELKKIDFLKIYTTGAFILQDEAIIYMENRFKNGLKEVVAFIRG